MSKYLSNKYNNYDVRNGNRRFGQDEQDKHFNREWHLSRRIGDKGCTWIVSLLDMDNISTGEYKYLFFVSCPSVK